MPSRFRYATQKTAGKRIQLRKQLHTVGDTIPTSAPTVGEVPAFGDVTSQLLQAPAPEHLPGTITTAGAVTVTRWWRQYHVQSVKSSAELTTR